LSPARDEGPGFSAGRPRAVSAVTALLIAVAIGLMGLGPLRGAVSLGLAAATVCAVSVLARRQVGGHTGDVLGACQQTAEIVILLAASAR
jgi:adenosylcobinamide-GDP ribazoletransferase